MSEIYSVGQYLVDRLAELGLRHLFSIAGDYSVEWVTRYVEASPIQVIEEVNELNAGYAADGYARLNGIGALCVTYSAGALCAVNAIAGAYVEKVPVVLINGTPSIQRTLKFEQTGYSSHHFISGRQTDRQVFEYITVATVRIEKPHLAPMLIDSALTACITERRPVYIELLEDVVDLPCVKPEGVLTAAPELSDEDGLAQAITFIAEKLRNATKPVIWLGVEIDRSGLCEQAAQLLQQLNVPFTTELMSKAILSEDNPLFVGVFDGKSSSAEVQSLMSDADFVLALGVWLTDLNDLGWPLDLNKTAFVSLYTMKFGTLFIPQVSIADVVAGLMSQSITRVAPALPAQVRPAAPDASSTSAITYQGFYDVVAGHVDDNTIVGADASLNYFGSMLLKVGAPRGFISQSSYSAIGYIGAAATGASLAKAPNQRLMIFTGDGGFQMTAQCLSTQTRFKLDPIIFIMDNGVYAVEQWLADAAVFDSTAPFLDSCVLHRWDYRALATVFGCHGWKAENYAELGAAIDAAKAVSDGPSVIHVVVSQRSIPDNARWKIPADASS
ncbi:thiamine pyrophosphate-dependent enzyme [Jiella sp. MQZ9-1]|uniref:Alpha-keto acid decarboxylase family protein n=1 Tax=Jiella flava TaxID=2816857 RepID=A0A939FV75_9HYPH|nr:thiamine pyrophosphate-dependent enzyme [Jiella flava]MBO0662112.1 alpha-keto acid decarboxylase family protein [Jiella flava]MCD2470560.1 thiamine pyrophosphate-dependent enzyme [Jiella flava]